MFSSLRIGRVSLACRALCLALLFLLSAGLFSVPANAQSIPKIQRGTTGQAKVTSDTTVTDQHPPPTFFINDSSGSVVYGPATPQAGDPTSWDVTASGSVTVPQYAGTGVYTFGYDVPNGPQAPNGVGPCRAVGGTFEVVSYPVPNHIKAPPYAGTDPNSPKGSPPFHPGGGGLPGGHNGSGPSNDPVNLSDGSELYDPDADLVSYNPNGPSASWQRAFSSFQSTKGYGTPGLASGWVSNYDVYITGTGSAGSDWSPLILNYPNGGTENWTPRLDSMGYPTGYFSTANRYWFLVRC